MGAGREIHTNPQTGEWFSISGHFASNEITATHVAGSLFEFRLIKAGQPAVIGAYQAPDQGAFCGPDVSQTAATPGGSTATC